MNFSEQAWVTSAWDDNVAIQALVLGRSLRRFVTSRKLVVIVSRCVSNSMRIKLAIVFDAIFDIDSEKFAKTGMSIETYTKVYCWNLTLFKKCVYVSPTNMIIRNSDYLFDYPAFSIAEQDVLNSVFVCKPSTAIYCEILEHFQSMTGRSSEVIGSFCIMKCESKAIPEDYNFEILKESNVPPACCIVRFSIEKPWDYMKSFSKNLENCSSNVYVQQWLAIYMQDVYPMVSNEHLETGSSDNMEEKDAIAIIGLSCRFPEANNVDEFWNLLITGNEGIRVIPEDRWKNIDHYACDPNVRKVEAGFLNCPVDEFDGKFFNMSPRELNNIDPQQRLLLEVTWEALENAGINPTTLAGTNSSVYTGVWTQDYYRLSTKSPNNIPEFHRNYMGTSFAATSGRVSYHLGLTGANIAVESGCSSSMVSLHLACENLLNGHSNLAIASGVNLLLHPFTREGVSATHILAADGRCKTFDSKADGFGRAEGCAAVILKRYSDAIKDGDRVMGLIRGTGISQEGTSSSFGTPSKCCQLISIKNALRNAHVSPSDVSYVEAHGTGTIVGDPIEVSAISSAYQGDRHGPLYIGSVKTNIGHTESCAGLAGLIKVVLALNNKIIPPHRNLQTLNPKIDLSLVPALINLDPVVWETRNGGKRFAGVSSFGISGTNVHLIVQEPPEQPGKLIQLPNIDRPVHILTLSAKSEKALKELVTRYQVYFKETANLAIENVCYTANTGRAQFKHRLAVYGRNVEEISMKLSKNAFKGQSFEVKPKVIFIFTGQGSQYVGMGKILYNTHPLFKQNMDHCAKLLRNDGIEILEALWGEERNNLDQSVYSQTGIFCIEYSLLKLWEHFGIVPDYVLGHSLGEFVAAIAAGILTLEDAIKLVSTRSRLVNKLPGGKMLAIRSDLVSTKKLIKEFMDLRPDFWIDIAVVNSNEEIVVAGRTASVETFEQFCLSKGVKIQAIASTQAFHSRDMDMILDEYGQVADKVSNRVSKCKYISGTLGKIINDQLDSSYWKRHARECVNFQMGVKTAFEEGCSVFIEIGAHPILLALAMNNNTENFHKYLWLPSIRRNEDEWSTVLQTLAKLYVNGFDINWTNFDSYYNRHKVALPTYPFQREKYWLESKIVENVNVDFNSKLLHPLLGRTIPTASSDAIYQNCLDLQTVSYITDHKVGQKIVMPGAGFLEMILASGHAATSAAADILLKPMTSILVQDFKIAAPLELIPEEPCETQVIVSMKNDETTLFHVSIYRKKRDESGNITWIQHAFGDFSPHVARSSEEKLDLLHIKRRSVEISTREVYEMLSLIGLNFGDKFKSVTNFWRNAKEILAEIPIAGKLDTGSYICHPVIIDALIQSIALSSDPDRKILQLPVGIEKFVLHGSVQGEKLFAYVRLENGTSVRLYDESGNLLANMEGIQTVPTTLHSFLNALNIQKRTLPGMFQEIWGINGGPFHARVDLARTPSLQTIKEDLKDDLKEMDRLEQLDKQFMADADRVCYYFILKAFEEIGWQIRIGEKISSWEFLNKFMICPRHHKLLEQFLTVLCEEGILRELKTGNPSRIWEVIGLPVAADILESYKTSIMEYKQTPIGDPVVVGLINECGEKLSRFLQGKENPLAVLFPENGKEDHVEIFYRDTGLCTRSNEIIAKTMEKSFTNSVGTLRILEIGAGTGSTTSYILSMLSKRGIKFQYTFTDISTVFLTKAKAKFSTEYRNVEYKILNIEEDPKSQGFSPNYFDIIIAANVLHATQSLQDSVSNIRQLLVPSGLFILFETFEILRTLNLTFGFLDGYFRFKDFDLRPHHAIIDAEKWTNLISKNGFQDITLLRSSGERGGVIVSRASATNSLLKHQPMISDSKGIWVVFTNENRISKCISEELCGIGKNVLTVVKGELYDEITKGYQYSTNPSSKEDIFKLLRKVAEKGIIEGIVYLWGITHEDKNQKTICEPLVYISQFMLSIDLKELPKLLVVTQGVVHIGDQDVENIAGGTLWGLTRTLMFEQPLLGCKLIDIDPEETDEELTVKEIINEIWSTDLHFQIAYRGRKRHTVRFAAVEYPVPLNLPPTERFQLVLPNNHKVADLTLGPASKMVIGNEDVEVCVQGTALNFRDLFIILKPDMFKSLYDQAVGTDFSGIITEIGSSVKDFKVGDPVFGICFTGAFSSHAVVPSHVIMHKPKTLTFLEASCLPSVFLTAYHCLIDIAKLTKADTILIHVASGGVGLVAIQIAQDIGATIIATAGSKRKRNYLKSLGIKYVFHSRNISYGDDILNVTNGLGVDVVLNSLTGPNFKETSLKVCKENARFVEMSKINIWQPEEVASLREDVKYWIVDLEKANPGTMRYLVQKMEEYLMKGVMRPLPYTRFELSQTREAFNFFQKAHHIGKIVVAMPKVRINKGKIQSSELLFNEESTYIITGGLGGIGMEVAKWMVKLGGKFIALVGRRNPDVTTSNVIKELNSNGACIFPLQVDVGNYSQVEQMLLFLKNNYPPVRGVMHAAGTIADGILSNQTWSKFETTFNAKVNGGWNLHLLTKQMNLEHFVLFSSIAAKTGPIGQSNHAAANSFLDTLAFHRNALGLPAQTINWGAWSEVGVAMNLAVGGEGAFGIKPFSPSQGLAALKVVLDSHETQTTVAEIDFVTLKKIMPHLTKIVGDLVKENVTSTEATMGCESFWKGIHDLGLEERIVCIKTQVESIVREVLKLPDSESIDELQNFSEMGMDSLMAVELRNNLQSLFGKKLTLNTTSLIDNPTTLSLSEYLAKLTCDIITPGIKTESEKVNLPNLEISNISENIEEKELRALIREDSQLPLHIKGNGNYPKPSQVRNILITGVTGQLGPHILHEISKRVNITVYCLVRAQSNGAAEARLMSVLKKNKLELFRNNVVGLAGSVTEKYFGLPENTYKFLCETIDAVWHLAVKSNHLEKYSKGKETKADLRYVNVFGTKKILKFAVEGRTKRVLYASSFVAVNKSADDGTMSELLPERNNLGEGINMGYSVSKFVCEKLMESAIQRGIPCQVIRYPIISGNSKTGMFFMESNHFMLFVMSCMKLGLYPKLPQGIVTLPVDISAELTTGIFFSDQSEQGAFNITNPYGGNQEVFLRVSAEFGFPMKLVDFSEFREKLKEEGNNSLLHSFKDIYLKEGGIEDFFLSLPAFQMKGQDTEKLHPLSKKIRKCLPNADEIIPPPDSAVRKQVEYAISIFARLGL